MNRRRLGGLSRFLFAILVALSLAMGDMPLLPTPVADACYNWSVGTRVGLKGGSEIRGGSGFGSSVYPNRVPHDNWQVDIIGGPRNTDGQEWWDISRKNLDGGGTGWVYKGQAGFDLCGSGGGGGSSGDGGGSSGGGGGSGGGGSGSGSSGSLPAGYSKCADEGGRCDFNGTKDVAYGANDKFTFKYGQTGGIDCNNGVFDDPLYGTRKACYIKDTGSGSLPAGFNWCAEENGRCNFNGTGDVAYGANNSFFLKKQITGGIDCNNREFRDPLFGTRKACYYKETQPEVTDTPVVGKLLRLPRDTGTRVASSFSSPIRWTLPSGRIVLIKDRRDAEGAVWWDLDDSRNGGGTGWFTWESPPAPEITDTPVVGKLLKLPRDTATRVEPKFSSPVLWNLPAGRVVGIKERRQIDVTVWWDLDDSRNGGGTGWFTWDAFPDFRSTPQVGYRYYLKKGNRTFSTRRSDLSSGYDADVKEDNWEVLVIGGPVNEYGYEWWDVSRAAVGDPTGGSGWFPYRSLSLENPPPPGGSLPEKRSSPQVGYRFGMPSGARLFHGPQGDVFRGQHTIVPSNDWEVVILDGPRTEFGYEWWDVSRKAMGFPNEGTGWFPYRTLSADVPPPPGQPLPEVRSPPQRGFRFALSKGTRIFQTGRPPDLASGVYTIVPEDNWIVVVRNGPVHENDYEWWDVDRGAAGDPDGGTGWFAYQANAPPANPRESTGRITPTGSRCVLVIESLIASDPTPVIGQEVRGTFTIKNTCQTSLTLSRLGIAGRGPNDAFTDFAWFENIVLGQGATYGYKAGRTFGIGGTHRLWVSYQSPDGKWHDASSHLLLYAQPLSIDSITESSLITSYAVARNDGLRIDLRNFPPPEKGSRAYDNLKETVRTLASGKIAIADRPEGVEMLTDALIGAAKASKETVVDGVILRKVDTPGQIAADMVAGFVPILSVYIDLADVVSNDDPLVKSLALVGLGLSLNDFFLLGLADLPADGSINVVKVWVKVEKANGATWIKVVEKTDRHIQTFGLTLKHVMLDAIKRGEDPVKAAKQVAGSIARRSPKGIDSFPEIADHAKKHVIDGPLSPEGKHFDERWEQLFGMSRKELVQLPEQERQRLYLEAANRAIEAGRRAEYFVGGYPRVGYFDYDNYVFVAVDDQNVIRSVFRPYNKAVNDLDRELEYYRLRLDQFRWID